MKTARRTELETNQLANWVGGQVNAVHRHQRLLIFVSIVAIVAAGAYLFTARQWRLESERQWERYLNAAQTGSVAELQDLAERYPATEVGQWSRLQLASSQLSIGMNAMFTDRPTANASLAAAQNNFRDLSNVTRDPMLKQEALLGLGRALESQNQIEEAKREYKKIVDQWPDTVFGQEASERIARLDAKSTLKFYEEFADFKPDAKLIDTPGTPGVRPDTNLDSLLDEAPPQVSESPKTTEPPKTDEPAKSSGATETPTSPTPSDLKTPAETTAPTTGDKPTDSTPSPDAP